MPCSRILTSVTTPVFVLVSSVAAFAQTPAPQTPITQTPAPVVQTQSSASSERMPGWGDLFRPLKGDFMRMASSQNLALATFGVAGAATAHTFDGRVSSSRWVMTGTSDMFQPGQTVGGVLVQAGAAVGTYAIGRATGNSRVADIGAKLFRAQVTAQATTQAIKFGTRRVRPDGSTLSFPSGHTASAFATASVLQRELGWKAGAPAYALAAWVAASRVQMHRHYLSDVIAGATVGLLAGRSVTVGSGKAKFAISPMVVPGGVGANFVKVGK